MLIDEDPLNLLLEAGFTKTQATLYLTLLSLGKSDAKTLYKQVTLPRQGIYRVLDELLKKGVIEKIIASPLKYEAISLRELLSNLQTKTNEYKKTLERAQFIIEKYEQNSPKQNLDEEYQISIVEGRETIIGRCRLAHSSAQHSVCCCSTFQRCIHVGQEINETIQKALDRGVKYQTVIERPLGEINLTKEAKSLMENDNFKVKIIDRPLKANTVIFDESLSSFNFYPSKAIGESPMIWTNHPSILSSFQETFNNLWNEASIFTSQKNLKSAKREAILPSITILKGRRPTKKIGIAKKQKTISLSPVNC